MCNYKVGFTSEGKLVAVDMQLYSNAGNSWVSLRCAAPTAARGLLSLVLVGFFLRFQPVTWLPAHRLPSSPTVPLALGSLLPARDLT